MKRHAAGGANAPTAAEVLLTNAAGRTLRQQLTEDVVAPWQAIFAGTAVDTRDLVEWGAEIRGTGVQPGEEWTTRRYTVRDVRRALARMRGSAAGPDGCVVDELGPLPDAAWTGVLNM